MYRRRNPESARALTRTSTSAPAGPMITGFGVKASPVSCGGRCATVTLTDALRPSLDAVITAAPRPMPVTTPDALTDTLSGADVVHVTTRPGSGLPTESRAVGTMRRVSPRVTTGCAAEKVIDATGTAYAENVTGAIPAALAVAVLGPASPSVHATRAVPAALVVAVVALRTPFPVETLHATVASPTGRPRAETTRTVNESASRPAGAPSCRSPDWI